MQNYRTQDGGQASEVYFKDVEVKANALLGCEGKSLASIEAVIERATLAICAESIGAMKAALAKTVEYAKTRVQFGVAISKFQALQHRMADMYVELELAKSLVLMTAIKLDQSADKLSKNELSKAVSAMKSQVGNAARLIGQDAVQIHGGVGVTEELDVGHYFKRLTMIEIMFGNTDFHINRFTVS
jgi:alkylation response protein AidB-like acyl-CoA dehydrogenase